MILKKGSRGNEVLKLQKDLQTLGIYNSKADSIFGPKTQRAVLEFQERYFVDGIADNTTLHAIKDAVESWASREVVRIIPVPSGLEEIEKQFGKIVYQSTGGGSVVILNDFADQNIVYRDFPIVGFQPWHTLLVDVLVSVLDEIKKRGLQKEIIQFGSWNPRHKMHDPKRQLSTHAWGISCDINWSTNPVGTRGDMDSGVIDVFERHGFEWGGRWRYKDSMHFQFCTGY